MDAARMWPNPSLVALLALLLMLGASISNIPAIDAEGNGGTPAPIGELSPIWERTEVINNSDTVMTSLTVYSGNIYACGYKSIRSDNNPEYNLSIEVFKYDQNGTLIWNRTPVFDNCTEHAETRSPLERTEGMEIFIDTGNLYIAGFWWDDYGESRLFVLNYALDGDFRPEGSWSILIHQSVSHLAVFDESIYFLCSLNDRNLGIFNMSVLKYDLTGILSSETGCDFRYPVLPLSMAFYDGHIYVAGDASWLNETHDLHQEPFLSRYDLNGTPEWNLTINISGNTGWLTGCALVTAGAGLFLAGPYIDRDNEEEGIYLVRLNQDGTVASMNKCAGEGFRAVYSVSTCGQSIFILCGGYWIDYFENAGNFILEHDGTRFVYTKRWPVERYEPPGPKEDSRLKYIHDTYDLISDASGLYLAGTELRVTNESYGKEPHYAASVSRLDLNCSSEGWNRLEIEIRSDIRSDTPLKVCVKDHAGQVVEGARVTFYEGSNAIGSSHTDENGVVKFNSTRNFLSHTYFISAGKPGFADAPEIIIQIPGSVEAERGDESAGNTFRENVVLLSLVGLAVSSSSAVLIVYTRHRKKHSQ